MKVAAISWMGRAADSGPMPLNGKVARKAVHTAVGAAPKLRFESCDLLSGCLGSAALGYVPVHAEYRGQPAVLNAFGNHLYRHPRPVAPDMYGLEGGPPDLQDLSRASRDFCDRFRSVDVRHPHGQHFFPRVAQPLAHNAVDFDERAAGLMDGEAIAAAFRAQGAELVTPGRGQCDLASLESTQAYLAGLRYPDVLQVLEQADRALSAPAVEEEKA